MGKSKKELAVELTIAEIQALSNIKSNAVQNGTVVTVEDANNMLISFYHTLTSLEAESAE